jgi:hypothetical protein
MAFCAPYDEWGVTAVAIGHHCRQHATINSKRTGKHKPDVRTLMTAGFEQLRGSDRGLLSSPGQTLFRRGCSPPLRGEKRSRFRTVMMLLAAPVFRQGPPAGRFTRSSLPGLDGIYNVDQIATHQRAIELLQKRFGQALAQKTGSPRYYYLHRFKGLSSSFKKVTCLLINCKEPQFNDRFSSVIVLEFVP